MWIVQPREHKDGFWRNCAESDEGAGFHEGCQHQHATEAEATACLEAEITLGGVTGFPAPDLDLAAAAYFKYAEQAGWKSLATGAELPYWEDLKVPIQAGWLASARELKALVTEQIKSSF